MHSQGLTQAKYIMKLSFHFLLSGSFIINIASTAYGQQEQQQSSGGRQQ
jgi:hypothetical protein